jgi:hypothetical protein
VTAALLPALLYSTTLAFEFVFDDLSLIGGKGPVFFGTEWLAYRPLRHLSHVLDNVIGGGQPWAYHFDNVVLHSSVCALTATLARRLGYAPLAALAAALLVGLHPLAVESVAYVSGRRDLLAGVLGMAALSAWISPSPRMWPALLLVVAAAGAKESGAVFLVILAAASAAGLGPPLREGGRWIATAAFASIALIAAYGGAGPLAAVATRVWQAGPGAALTLAGHYMAGITAMRPLSVVYPYLDAAGGLTAVEVMSMAAVVGVCIAGAMRLAGPLTGLEETPDTTGRAAAAFLAAWAVIVLASVVCGAGFHEPGADRHAYPLLPPVALLVCGVFHGHGHGHGRALRAITFAAAAVVIASFAGVTASQVRIWRNPETLWSAAVRDAPRSARAQHNLAGVLLAGGHTGKARRHLERALQLDENYAPAYLGLARIACANGYPAKAAEYVAAARSQGAAPADLASFEDVAACAAPGPE